MIFSFLKGCDASRGITTKNFTPEKISSANMIKYMKKKDWNKINEVLKLNGLKPKGGASIDPWITYEEWNWTHAHSEHVDVHCVLLKGYKKIYLGPNDDGDSGKGRIDACGNVWTISRQNVGSRMWNVNNKRTNLAKLYESAGFKVFIVSRRCSLYPAQILPCSSHTPKYGDAIHFS